VLIEAQSVDEFTNRLADRETWPLVIVSLSPQSLASIATYYNLSMAECYQKLNTFFVTKLGVNYVFDTSFSRDLALLEQAEEFVQKYRSEHRTEQLPLLASSCPGWICYAEKSQGEFILPFISSTKSPQQIMGTLVKQFLPKILAQRNGNSEPVPPSRVLHVTVMPCFDKKLEASRDEFYSDVLDSHDVDLVLTSLEIPQLLQKTDTDFLGLPPTPIEPLYVANPYSLNTVLNSLFLGQI
jgi:iron only hydrogenase large subunit-like protein